jgi:LysR family glycine cleavage system transcriptional activator
MTRKSRAPAARSTRAATSGDATRLRSAATSSAKTKAIRRLPLASLRVFVAVAEHGALGRAADALGVTAAAVTMQVQSLEQYLGMPLLHRRGRHVELTQEGLQLLPAVRHGLGEIEAAVDRVRSSRGQGPLKVTLLASFLQQWMLPRLGRFRAAHPAVDLRFHTSNSNVRFEGTDIHAAIRLGRGDWPDLVAEHLMDEWYVPVCEPKLLESLGPIETPLDLARYTLLHSTSEPWTAWTDAPGLNDEWPESGSTFDDSTAIIRAAEQGYGLALARWSLVAQSLADGALVLASRRIVRGPRSYWFVVPPAYAKLDKIRRFHDWLKAEAAATPRPPGAEAAREVAPDRRLPCR